LQRCCTDLLKQTKKLNTLKGVPKSVHPLETIKKGTDREEKEHSDLPPLVRGGVERSETEG